MLQLDVASVSSKNQARARSHLAQQIIEVQTKITTDGVSTKSNRQLPVAEWDLTQQQLRSSSRS
jgi:hypothetical protein